MAFSNNSYVRIWEVENKGNYSVANVSSSKKNKDTDTYETDFQYKFVRLVGQAHEFVRGSQIPNGGLAAKITSCSVTNKYDQEKKTTFWNCTIFGLEDANTNGNASSKKASAAQNKAKKSNSVPAQSDDDEMLPF